MASLAEIPLKKALFKPKILPSKVLAGTNSDVLQIMKVNNDNKSLKKSPAVLLKVNS